MSQPPLDRKQACDAYTDQYPDDEWDIDLHIIVSDYNFEDHWLYNAISLLSDKLSAHPDNPVLQRRFLFLVDLLKLPMPEGWDDHEDESEEDEIHVSE